jgi:hypothetical protein
MERLVRYRTRVSAVIGFQVLGGSNALGIPWIYLFDRWKLRL